ncbi:MotA/TolQ/ExbB proton channel family protein [Spiribacter sp. 218]|uniref:MotA/TolQ/ExbB proton channel family protein n=1 Tax=Spiribacter pallidus TaxID=1987936 RepID=UPI00349F061E
MESDLIFDLVSITLIGMSVLTWTIGLGKLRQLYKARQRAGMFERAFDHSMEWPAFRDVGNDATAGDAVYLVQNLKQVCAEYSGADRQKYSFEQLQTMLATEIQRKLGAIARHKESWMNALASISSTAPFLGLFGTVWGIMKALVMIGETGAANITVVATPIGGALITTAFGIVTAIPAVIFHNLINRKIRQHIGQLENFSEALLRYVLHHRDRWSEVTR